MDAVSYSFAVNRRGYTSASKEYYAIISRFYEFDSFPCALQLSCVQSLWL